MTDVELIKLLESHPQKTYVQGNEYRLQKLLNKVKRELIKRKSQ